MVRDESLLRAGDVAHGGPGNEHNCKGRVRADLECARSALRRHFAFPCGTARRFASHPSLGRGRFVGSLQERRSPHAFDPRLPSFELLLVEELCTSLIIVSLGPNSLRTTRRISRE
jgi:hypothetical protein